MSAFIVSNKTINAVVFGITRWMENESESYVRSKYPLLRQRNTALMKAILDLNIEAVCQRYDLNRAKDFENLNYRYQQSYYITPIVSYKSLCCLLYQCSEGDIPETPLFKELVSFQHDLAASIITNTKEYNEAPWDL